MADTIVGSVSYDTRLNLPQLIKDAKQAEKIVRDSKAKIDKIQSNGKSSGSTTSASKASAPSDVVARSIEQTKQAARASFDSLAQYTPKIQAQFLAVERANMRVEASTLRSATAITKYGADSTQAKSATNSLSGAVLSQSQQQQRLKAMLDGTSNSSKNFSGSMGSSTAAVVGLGAAISATVAVGATLRKGVNDANQYQSALLGLDSVSQAFGQSQDKVRQAAIDLSSDGLIPITQSVMAFKNALATGYSIEQATALLKGLKDQAAFNRQSYYDLGGAVVATTEGIRNGNSVLADATGTTTNLSVMAKKAGIDLNDMANSETKAAYQAAILDGFLVETNRSMGDAATYSQTAAGSQSQLSYQMNALSVNIGKVTNALTQGLTRDLASFIAINNQSIVSVGAGVLAFATVATVVPLVVKGIRTVIATLKAFTVAQAIATGGVGLLAVALGVAAGATVSSLFDGMTDVKEATDDAAGSAGKMENSLGGSSKQANDLAKQLKKIDEEMSDVRSNFQEQLAELVRSKRESISELNDQLASEKSAYDKSYSDRLFDFNKSQQEELQTHQSKVARLTTQIDFLKRYQNDANKQQLSNLQFALARENSLYTQQTTERKGKYDQDAEAERVSYEKRQAELQIRLAAETALLDKHRADVESIRGVILLDEIDKLKRGRDEQLRSLEQQRIDAISSNASTGSAAGTAFGDALSRRVSEAMGKMKTDVENSMTDGDWLKRLQNNFQRNWERNGGDFWKPLKDSFGRTWGLLSGTMEIKNGQIISKPGGGGGWAEGGFTGRGAVNEPAGVVHRGEYVLPQSMVNQSTGLPKLEALSAPNVASGATYNINITASASMLRSEQDKRDFAKMIFDAFNQDRRAKALPQIGVN